MSPKDNEVEKSMQQQPIFFLHNPKAGGSSLQSTFHRLFNVDEIAPTFSNAPNNHLKDSQSIDQRRGYKFYAGHYGYDVFRELGDGHALVTNFRDPVARIISLYRYWRNNISVADLAGLDPKDAAIVMYSHELDFSSFIRCEEHDLQLYINNFHFRQLLKSPWEFPKIRNWDTFFIKKRISAMPWFYVAETPELSTMLLKRQFPEIQSFILPFVNISQGDPIVATIEDVEYLVSLNRLDNDIYQYAIREQYARVRESLNKSALQR